jgi:hypothetical protein
MYDFCSYMHIHIISVAMLNFGKCNIVSFLSLPFLIIYQLHSVNLEYCVFQSDERLNWCESEIYF